MDRPSSVLTASRMANGCGFLDVVRYEAGLRLSADRPPALRIGSAIHAVLEEYRRTGDYDPNRALDLIVGEIESEADEEHELFYVLGIVAAYAAHYGPRLTGKYEALATERPWTMAPGTRLPGGYVLRYWWGGVVDDVVLDMATGRPRLWETKSTSFDILPGGDFWLDFELRDQDVIYHGAYAASPKFEDLRDRYGERLEGTIRDAVRKPPRKVLEVAQTDDDDVPIVIDDESGLRARTKAGTWRRAGGSGFTRLVERETPATYSDRIRDLMLEAPSEFFQLRTGATPSDEVISETFATAEAKRDLLALGGRDTSQCVGRYGSTCELIRFCSERLDAVETVRAAMDTDLFHQLAWPHREIDPKEAF